MARLEFYLEALDRDVKKPHEQPSIGVLLCATKNNEVVEYALSRAMSPGPRRRIPDPAAGQEAAPGQAPRVLRLAESQAEADAGDEIWSPARGTIARHRQEAKGPQEVMTAPYRKKLIEVGLTALWPSSGVRSTRSAANTGSPSPTQAYRKQLRAGELIHPSGPSKSARWFPGS